MKFYSSLMHLSISQKIFLNKIEEINEIIRIVILANVNNV